MFAIGFLSLLTVGFVAMAADDGDDSAQADQSGDSQDDYNVELGDVQIAYEAGDDLDPENQDQIDEFVEGIQADPNRPIEDVVGELHAFLDGLEQDENGEETASDDVAAEEEVIRPPMGDEYRDPLKIAEQRVIAEAEAREPVNLVTVFDGSNSEIDDALVLTENANSSATGEASFTVAPSEGPNAIEVNFDYAHTFQINYTEETESVIASLNSDILGPEGETVTESTTETDSDGALRTTTIESKEYSGSTDIILSIDFDQIGMHFSKIDLSNPEDTLHLEFEGIIPGNLHMIVDESEDREPGDNSSTKTAYIIHTPEALTAVSQTAIDAFKETDNGQIVDSFIVAEIYLGEDSVVTTEGSVGDGAYELLITNFINDNPSITTNIQWTSEGEPTTAAGTPTTNGGNGLDADSDDGMSLPFDLGSFFGG